MNAGLNSTLFQSNVGGDSSSSTGTSASSSTMASTFLDDVYQLILVGQRLIVYAEPSQHLLESCPAPESHGLLGDRLCREAGHNPSAAQRGDDALDDLRIEQVKYLEEKADIRDKHGDAVFREIKLHRLPLHAGEGLD